MSKNSGRGLPDSIERPIPQDVLYKIQLLYNKCSDYERTEYEYVWGYCHRDAEKTMAEYLIKDGWTWDEDAKSFAKDWEYVRIKESQEFVYAKIYPINGASIGGENLGIYLMQQVQDKRIWNKRQLMK